MVAVAAEVAGADSNKKASVFRVEMINCIPVGSLGMEGTLDEIPVAAAGEFHKAVVVVVRAPGHLIQNI